MNTFFEENNLINHFEIINGRKIVLFLLEYHFYEL